jgi:putative spermidine/putrescine transport system ATP-binding protein
MSGASVSYQGVSKSYGAVNALLDFNLTVKPGEIMTFLGASGSGKTTALNVLAGFTDVSSGVIEIGGRPVVGLPPERRNVGMVFQSYSLFPHMSVFQNVAFPLGLRKVSSSEQKSRVEAALKMVQLSSLADRMPNELSGGQKQRVAFARAIVFEPPVLLMDEPLGALDLKLRQAMQVEIREYQAQLGCTIIFVTHDQSEALALSDRIAVIDQGRIIQLDTADRIYDAPNSRFVAEFIGKTNILNYRRDGADRITIPELELSIDAAKINVGKSGLLSIRPEKLFRVAETNDNSVVFPGQIAEVLFQGDLVHYTVALSGGKSMQFQEHRGPGSSRLKLNDQHTFGFLISDALPLKQDDEITK